MVNTIMAFMTKFFGNASQLSKFCMISIIGLAFTVKAMHENEAGLIGRIEDCHKERLKELKEILDGNRQVRELYKKAADKTEQHDKSKHAEEDILHGCCGDEQNTVSVN